MEGRIHVVWPMNFLAKILTINRPLNRKLTIFLHKEKMKIVENCVKSVQKMKNVQKEEENEV